MGKIYLFIVTLCFSGMVMAKEDCVGDDLWCNNPTCTEVWCQGDNDGTAPGTLAPACAAFLNKSDQLAEKYRSTGLKLGKLTKAEVNADRKAYAARKAKVQNELSRLPVRKQTETCQQMARQAKF